MECIYCKINNIIVVSLEKSNLKRRGTKKNSTFVPEKTKGIKKWDDIYIIKGTDTVEICIKGGIVAVYGMNSIFMVHSVMAVSTTDKVKRDANKTTDPYAQGKAQQSLFAEILDQEVDERRQAAPRECHTVTYGQDCMLRNFLYQKREYHY